MAGGNGTGNGAGTPSAGNGAAGGGEAGNSNSEMWLEFRRSIEGLGPAISENIERALGSRLDKLNNTVTDGLRAPEPPPVDPNEGFDFDTATNVDMYNHVMGQVEGMIGDMITNALDQALKPYADSITGLRTELVTDKGGREIERLQADNKDFVDFVPEMKALAQQHPSLSLKDIYGLAKYQNPSKAAELDKKYNPPPAPPARPFSLAPTGAGTTLDSTTNRRRPMTKQEGAIAAFNEVNERHGGVLGALESAFPEF